MTDETPSNADLKRAFEAQMNIIDEFVSFLERAFPQKNIRETFTDLKMTHRIPDSVYKDPSIMRL